MNVDVLEGGSKREVHMALQECCDRTKKEVIEVKTEIDTTVAEAEFLNCIPKCQIVPW